ARCARLREPRGRAGSRRRWVRYTTVVPTVDFGSRPSAPFGRTGDWALRESMTMLEAREMILIVTVANDLHALSVRDALRSAGVRDCHIIECDRIAQRDVMSYGLNYSIEDRIVSSDGEAISMSDGEVLWLRTLASDQEISTEMPDE